jgi:hypothetical protein
LFLAAKTTNHPIALEAYTGNIPKTSPNDVLELEFLLAQSLSFEFAVWHAHRSMWGLWLDLQVSLSLAATFSLEKLTTFSDTTRFSTRSYQRYLQRGYRPRSSVTIHGCRVYLCPIANRTSCVLSCQRRTGRTMGKGQGPRSKRSERDQRGRNHDQSGERTGDWRRP